MRRIVIPTDFSDTAWNAAVYAMRLFRNTTCEFTFLNCHDVDAIQLSRRSSTPRAAQIYKVVKESSQKNLKMILQDVHNSKQSKEHIFKIRSEPGTVIEVLDTLMKPVHFDMIVIGTKGATGAAELFLGSTTHKVIRQLYACPILVIPDEANYKSIADMAFVTNFEHQYQKSETRDLVALAKTENAVIRLLHVYKIAQLNKEQQYNSNTLEKYLQQVPYYFHVIQNFATLEKAIEAFIEELEIDLLAMVHYKHSFLERLLRESVIKKLTFHIKIPFLVIPTDI